MYLPLLRSWYVILLTCLHTDGRRKGQEENCRKASGGGGAEEEAGREGQTREDPERRKTFSHKKVEWCECVSSKPHCSRGLVVAA